MHPSDSGPLALPRDAVIQRAAGFFDVDTEPLSTAPASGRVALNRSDVAQARMFEQMLRTEIAQLEQRADAIAYQWWVRRVRDTDPQPEELAEVRRRIDEARRLLETLQGRFLRPRR